jgi:hypothetical protein
MAKRGQHSDDAHDYNVSHGHNNPAKSVTITAGTPKKHATYAEQARRHEDPGRQAQAARNDWNEDTRVDVSNSGSTRARHPRSGRSGSDSNA